MPSQRRSSTERLAGEGWGHLKRQGGGEKRKPSEAAEGTAAAAAGAWPGAGAGGEAPTMTPFVPLPPFM